MTITLYSGFTKRTNSTKQPSSGTDVTVTLKEPTSIENPSFELSGGVSSSEGVTAVKWGSRYYFVTDITSDSYGVTTISCTLDRGATYKSAIGATKAFIERCYYNHSYDLRDELILTTDNNFFESLAGGALFPSALSTGVIVVALANIAPTRASGGTADLAYFDAPGGTYTISNLIRALYDNNVIQSIEKILAKPYDAILSVRYIPGFTTTNLTATGKFTNDNTLYFGDHLYTIDNVHPTGTGPWTYTKSYEFDISSNAHFSLYKWRNLAPYSRWDMFLPFYGTISIPAEEYLNVSGGSLTNLVVRVTVDLTTGELVYTRYRKVYTGGVGVEYFAQEYRTTIGIDIPIQGSNRDMLSFTTDIVSGAGTVALLLASGGSAAPAIAAGAGAGAKAVLDVAQQQIITAGTFNAHGTQIALAEPNNVYLMQTGYETQTSPTSYEAEIGAPLMEVDTISNRPGYIKCNNASVSMTGTQADKDAVNAMLNSGFFYE